LFLISKIWDLWVTAYQLLFIVSIKSLLKIGFNTLLCIQFNPLSTYTSYKN